MDTSNISWQEQFEAGYPLDTYTLIERLGYGGQGVVWSAWDNQHKRVVAVKIVSFEDHDPTGEVSAFERGAPGRQLQPPEYLAAQRI